MVIQSSDHFSAPATGVLAPITTNSKKQNKTTEYANTQSPTSLLLLLPTSLAVGRLPRPALRHIFIRVEEGKGSDADLDSFPLL